MVTWKNPAVISKVKIKFETLTLPGMKVNESCNSHLPSDELVQILMKGFAIRAR
jgi:hypothetical protein